MEANTIVRMRDPPLQYTAAEPYAGKDGDWHVSTPCLDRPLPADAPCSVEAWEARAWDHFAARGYERHENVGLLLLLQRNLRAAVYVLYATMKLKN